MNVLLRCVVLLVAFCTFITHSPSGIYSQAINRPLQSYFAYMNLGSGLNQHSLAYYSSDASNTEAVFYPAANLTGYAARFVPDSAITGSPRPDGSLQIISQLPVSALSVQWASSLVNRPIEIYRAATTSSLLVPTFLKNTYNTSSRLYVVNDSPNGVNYLVTFYNLANQAVYQEAVYNAAPYHAKVFDAANMAGLGAMFDGSAVAEITSGSGQLKGGVLELGTVNYDAAAFSASENVSAYALFMPSAMCNAFGGSNTAYAIQNTSGTAYANVNVIYRDANNQVVSLAGANIGPRAKFSFVGCANGLPSGFSGSATVTSGGAPIAGVMKVYGNGANAIALAPYVGSTRVALPYIRWSPDANYNAGVFRRTFLAVQALTNSGAGTLRFFDENGNQMGGNVPIPALLAGQKISVNPGQTGMGWMGYYPGGYFEMAAGAVAEVSSGSIVVVARTNVVFNGQIVSEDYIGQGF